MRGLVSMLLATTVMALTGMAATAVPAQAVFGLHDFNVTFTNADGSPATQAGSHPFEMRTSFAINTKPDPGRGELPFEDLRNAAFEQIAGLVGNPTAVPRCATVDFLTKVPGKQSTTCPDSTAVGVIAIHAETPDFTFNSAVYNLVPPPGAAAKLGFVVFNVPVAIEVGVRPSAPYNISGMLSDTTQLAPFYSSVLRIWGNPTDPLHDPYRGSCLDINNPAAYPEVSSRGNCPTDIPKKPFLTLPRSCRGPLFSSYAAVSWQNAATATGKTDAPVEMGGCSELGFDPKVTAQPSTASAESASGVDVELKVDDKGIVAIDGKADSDIQKIVTTFPKGMTINPSAAEGLGACSEGDLERESPTSAPGVGCPQSSKLGTVRVQTPILEEETLEGTLYLATPYANPMHTLIAVYLVVKSEKLGIIVKLPGKVEPDPQTGQVISTFDDLPQFPLSDVSLRLSDGPRSPLVTPPRCGTYVTTAELTPAASPTKPIVSTSAFDVDSGMGGGPCPEGGQRSLRPGFEAGSSSNAAAQYSPFYMRLTRNDGEPEMTSFSSVLPPGLTGKLAGVAQCPAAAIATAAAKTGSQELSSPSCPPASQIGRVLAGAGVGNVLTYVSGKLYLAGPYAGSPLSIVAVTPAVAGPFDVGDVVVRVPLKLNPTTAEIEVDGLRSDRFPQVLAGIPLRLRDLRVYVDRDRFTLNPTSCAPSSVRATLFGSFLDVFSIPGEVSAPLSSRYQAAGCAGLGFKPKLALSLKGATKRSGTPALRAVVTPRPGDANIGKAVVTFPHSTFLEQAHIRTICTRVQFAAQSCPKGSVYGRARAISPLLDEPLEGPVYLRSSSHPLPDLVFALNGIVDIDVVGRIDSVKARLRASFETVPDQPVSKFVVRMQGGQKGLLVNSRNLCAHPSHASARFVGQNGRAREVRPLVKPLGCKKSRKGRHGNGG